MAIDPIGPALDHFPSRSYSICELFKHFDGRVPVNACICDTNSLLESCWSFWWYFLCAFVDVGLDHHSHDTCLALAKLVTNGLSYFGLILVVLEGVS